MANPVSSVDVPLSLFSGWNTELSPPDQPEGASPANNDVVFTPGSVATRPGVNRVFAVEVDALGPFSYEKSFVDQGGNIKNLYLTKDDGILWVEDVTNTPGIATQLFQSAGATYASSCTAQFREYIALSDGVHGADVPLTYDGVNLWRTTQDGPAQAPTVQSVALAASTLTPAPNCLTRFNNTVTGNTATNHNLQVGYQVQISNFPNANSASQVVSSSTGTGTATSLWSFVSNQWRSNFNPGNSALTDLYFTGFGFAIPGSASIIGVKVSAVLVSQSTTTGTLASVALWYSGSQEGTAKTPGTAFTTTPTAQTYGTSTDLWGASLTPAIVNDPSFGFAMAADCDSVRVFIGIPFMVTVYYTVANSGVVAEISTIVINNELAPGVATVTTTAPHGLLPNNQISILDVTGATVGTAISNVAFSGGVVTITTSAAHGLSVNSEVQVAAGTAQGVNGEWLVAAVPTIDTFTYLFPGTITNPAGTNVITEYSASDTGTVTYIWPLANADPSQDYFTVQTAPSPTTFTMGISYTDGTWTGGIIIFSWNGIFYVTAVPSATQFQYQQYGPNAATTGLGTVTPYGQAAPGLHQVRVSYLLASGDITAPSPPSTFVANGGQYLQVSGIPKGPSNVTARVLQFTGAGGAYYFYLATQAQVNGLIVSTATQINDNTTTSALLDFSDNTLYAAGANGAETSGACSVPGNNLSAQVVLGPYSGSFTYASRLLAWGERNKVQNLLNMGFDADGSGTNAPQGWTATGTPDAGVTISLATRPPGAQWRLNCSDSQTLSQSAYLDSFGAPILLPNTSYKIRLWIKASYVGTGGPNFVATLTSASTSYTSTVTILNAAMTAATAGSFLEATFSLATPATIPSDLLFNFTNSVTGPAYSLDVDEIELIYVQQPYIDNQARISYADNFGGFDIQTGVIGAEDDTSPIRNFGVIRKSLYWVTGTGLHETQDNDQTEPSGWTVDQIADNCGAFSIASVGRNAQGIGSAGKDWMMWSGPDGAQIFTGQKPFKISQEIQSVWDAIPAATQYQCWVKNFENAKWCFFGIPTASSMQVLVLDYRNIDGALIAENPPIHISFTGKMIVSDLTRKWTTWTLPAYCGELMYRNTIASPQIVFGCQAPAGGANAYILNPNQYHDDDFGLIPASYTTYFFVSHEMEQALQVGSHRHVYTMSQAFISGVGTWTLTPLAAALTNPFPTSSAYPLSLEPNFDMDFGINVETTRCAFTVQSQPISGTDSYFKLQKIVINMAPAPWVKVRGSAGGAF